MLRSGSSRCNSHNTTKRSTHQDAARTPNQQRYMQALQSPGVKVVVVHGPAGTGKTRLAVSTGLHYLLAARTSSGQAGSIHASVTSPDIVIDKLILVRPTVSVAGESHGYLPGTLSNKMQPWMQPILDAASDYIEDQQNGGNNTSDKKRKGAGNLAASLVKSGVLEFAPLSHMRGRTFKNSWVICDEAQNCTPAQMLLLLTRLGASSKMVINGDLNQHDLMPAAVAGGCPRTGLGDLLQRLRSVRHTEGGTPLLQSIVDVELTEQDVQRSDIVSQVLQLYSPSSPS
jgi:phosphate starvation-inducible PhoH-like protein